jgi:hypothetical protein
MQKPIYYGYVADMEAKYSDGKSNRALIAELSGKERTSERLLYKEVAHIVSSLHHQWDREKYAVLDKDEKKTVHFDPELIVYPDGSKKFSCTVYITHLDFSLLAIDLPTNLYLQEKKHPFTACSIEVLTHTLTPAYDFAFPYVKAGYQPKMYSVRTITPEIHFPGYCPSPIPEYVLSRKKPYREPPIYTFDHAFIQERLVAVKPWYPLPDELASLLVTFELIDGSTLYDLRAVYYAFRPIVGLKLEKELAEGYAIAKRSVYDLAWLCITPFARELTRLHTYEKYYLE